VNLDGQQSHINKLKVGKGLKTNKMPHSNMFPTTSNEHMINKSKGRRIHNKISTPRLRRWTTHEILKKGMEGRVVLALVSFLHSKDLRVFLIYDALQCAMYHSITELDCWLIHQTILVQMFYNLLTSPSQPNWAKHTTPSPLHQMESIPLPSKSFSMG